MDRELIQERVDQYDGTEWGSALITPIEVELLGKRLRELEEEGDPHPRATLAYELQEGVIYIPDEVTMDDVVEAGAYGGCPVIPDVFENFPDLKDAIWHYFAKARAYRYIFHHIQGVNPELAETWRGAERLESGIKPVVDSIRPKGIDPEVLLGKEKLWTSYPSNLFRLIEAVRNGKKGLTDLNGHPVALSEEEMETLQSIDWMELAPSIAESAETSTNIADLSVKTIKETYRRLGENLGRKILRNALNPTYHLLERGEIEKLKYFWQKLYDSIAGDPTLDSNYEELNYDIWNLFDIATRRYNELAEQRGMEAPFPDMFISKFPFEPRYM